MGKFNFIKRPKEWANSTYLKKWVIGFLFYYLIKNHFNSSLIGFLVKKFRQKITKNWRINFGQNPRMEGRIFAKWMDFSKNLIYWMRIKKFLGIQTRSGDKFWTLRYSIIPNQLIKLRKYYILSQTEVSPKDRGTTSRL